jgi:hypothetical protein
MAMVSRLNPLVGLLLISCTDPMPPETDWLAGTWQWDTSCCDASGGFVRPAATDTLVISLHHNGDYEVIRGGVVQTRSRFSVIPMAFGGVVSLEQPLLGWKVYQVFGGTGESMAWYPVPESCDSCYVISYFFRVE